MRVIRHWISGKVWDGEPDRVGDVYNPATGEVTAQVAFASRDEVDIAVANAAWAFPQWRDTSLTKRASVMFAFREVINKHKDELARIIVNEHGKTVSDALGEITRGLEVVEFACGIPHLIKGEFSENVSTGVDMFSIRQPVGVVAGITPFNFPAMVPMWMFPIAIACGNTFVLKPSEKDPSVANYMAELLGEAGLPEGVFNVMHGDKIAVDSLLQHPKVAAVSSVGSTPVARYIYQTAARYGKRVQALGGAKNHMIVLPDADMELTADSLIGSAYGSAGERCMSVSAVAAIGDAVNPLLAGVQERIEKLKVGPGWDTDSQMGPLITPQHYSKVLSCIETGIQEGAELVVDGRNLKISGHESGFFLGPCVFDRVTPEMSIYKEEIFGPVLTIVRSRTVDDAIALVNANRYGNGTAVFTNDGGVARKFQHEVDIGMVGINVPIPVPLAFYSFGGRKQSLFGDSHIHGPEGVRFYTRGKVITTRWPDPGSRALRLEFPTST